MKNKIILVLLIFGILSSAAIVYAWGPPPTPEKQYLDCLNVQPAKYAGNLISPALYFTASYLDDELNKRVYTKGVDLDVIVWDKKSKEVMMDFPAKSDRNNEGYSYELSNDVVNGMNEGREYNVDVRVSPNAEGYYCDKEGHACICISDGLFHTYQKPMK